MNGMPIPPPGGFPHGMPPMPGMPGFPPNFMPPGGFPPPAGGYPPPFPPQHNISANAAGTGLPAVVLPPIPTGVDLEPGQTAPDSISRTLTTLPPAQLLDCLKQMKQLVATDPEAATELLRRAPQLSYAIFQALLLMGLVKADQLATVVETSARAVASDNAAAAAAGAQSGTPLPHHAPPPQSYPPQGGYQAPPQQGGYPTPPVAAPVPAPAPAAAPPADDPSALIQQVLSMPQEIIDALPPAEKAQILALRAQFGGR